MAMAFNYKREKLIIIFLYNVMIIINHINHHFLCIHHLVNPFKSRYLTGVDLLLQPRTHPHSFCWHLVLWTSNVTGSSHVLLCVFWLFCNILPTTWQWQGRTALFTTQHDRISSKNVTAQWLFSFLSLVYRIQVQWNYITSRKDIVNTTRGTVLYSICIRQKQYTKPQAIEIELSSCQKNR